MFDGKHFEQNLGFINSSFNFWAGWRCQLQDSLAECKHSLTVLNYMQDATNRSVFRKGEKLNALILRGSYVMNLSHDDISDVQSSDFRRMLTSCLAYVCLLVLGIRHSVHIVSFTVVGFPMVIQATQNRPPF